MADIDIEGKPGSITDDFMYGTNVAQAHIYIRMAFLRKVYGLLGIQLLITTLFAACCMFTPIIRFYIHNNEWLMSVAFIASLGLIIALHIKRRETPLNFILLALFTVVQAYTVGVICTYFDQLAVIQAFFITFSVVAFLTLYTLQTKRDFSSWGVGLFAAIWVLLIAGMLQIFMGTTVMELGISVGGALIFSLFIMFDTQMIMQKVSPEEYILATINLYLDIINLFMYILRILESSRRH